MSEPAFAGTNNYLVLQAIQPASGLSAGGRADRWQSDRLSRPPRLAAQNACLQSA